MNGVALSTLQIIFPNLVDIGCFSHTVNLAGERFKIPLLVEFINARNSLFVIVPRLGFAGGTTVEGTCHLTAQRAGGASGKS